MVHAAHAMVQIVNTRMADKIRVLASQRAIALHDFTLVAGGGAGAVRVSNSLRGLAILFARPDGRSGLRAGLIGAAH